MDLVLVRSLGALLAAGLAERDRIDLRLEALPIVGGRLLMLAGCSGPGGARPRGAIGEPEAVESSEEELIAVGVYFLKKLRRKGLPPQIFPA